MRNLKRALSLTLASVMLLGMMVVGSSAAAGYDDVDENDNVEAIEVLQAVEVMVGDDRGFGPDRPVTRNEMAVVMGKLLNLDYNYYTSTCPFSDVATWARGWVGACAANGIVSGRGNGIYDGESTVTAVEAASMMMRALGYFKYTEDYADGFLTSTVRQGSQIGIFDGVGTDGTTPMTRNQVAQMALNALQTDMVDFTGTPGVSVNGVTVGYRAEYTPRTSTEAKYQAIEGRSSDVSDNSAHRGQYYVQLGEELYNGDLKLYDNRTDVFGRPARRWEYDGKAIGTYMKTEMLREQYTDKVTGKMLYELLGKDVVDDYDFYISVDGEDTQAVLDSVKTAEKDRYFFDKTALNRTNTNQVGGTNKGVLTQVFVDGNDKEVYIAVINTYLAKADSDYNTRRDEASFTIWNISQYSKGSVKALVKADDNFPGVKVSGDDFDIEDVKTDDIFLVRVAENEIQEIIIPEIVDNTTISAFKNGSYVVTEGTQYDYASAARYDAETLDEYSQNNMKDTTYRIYLDPYGYLIGIEEIDSEDHYVFLTGINSNTENLKDQTAIGNVIFLDGTDKNITIDMKESENAQGNSFNNNNDGETKVSSLMNTWCTYSVDDNNLYTLKEVANTAATVGAKGVKAGQRHMGGTYDADALDSAYVDCGTAYSKSHDAVKGNVDKPTGKLTFGTTVDKDGNLIKDGTSEKYVTINKGNVSLNGIADSAYKKVYGNNDTVYLSAETDIITAKTALYGVDEGGDFDPSNQLSVIITAADSISIGVQSTDLDAWNAQAVVKNETKYQKDGMYYENVSDGVYTLFNDKGYVIAAMVVGEDDGSNTDYAWVSSGSMEKEGYGSGKWTYLRDVIIDGKEATLTEEETSGTKTPDISKNTSDEDDKISFWWKVRTKGDGTVKEAVKVDKTTIGSDQYVTDMDDIGDDGTTVLEQLFPVDVDKEKATYKVRVTGNTLQVESSTGKVRGFAVAPDAGIAVVKDQRIYENGKPIDEWKWKEDIDYLTNDDNAGGLKTAVSRLTDSDNFKGYIAAVLKDGRAECVILYDKADADVDIGGISTGSDLSITEWPETYLNITSTKSMTAREVAEAIKTWLNDDDIERVEYARGTATVYYNNDTTVTYTVNRSTVSSAAEIAGADLIGKTQDKIGASSTTGKAVEVDGNKITTIPGTGDGAADASTNYVKEDADGTAPATKDLVAFLVQLHEDGATQIKIGKDTYKWYGDLLTDKGNKMTCQWAKTDAKITDNKTDDTLVKAIVDNLTDQIKKIGEGTTKDVPATLVVDGAEIVVAIRFTKPAAAGGGAGGGG